MPEKHRFRFKVWHLFVLVAAGAVVAWAVSQIGMETAEIVVLEFDTWPRIDAVTNERVTEVINVEFRYLEPVELRHTSLVLFFDHPTFTEADNIEVGTHVRFRYRARPLFGLKSEAPDTIAIKKLQLALDSIQEKITVVHMFDADE